MLLPEVNEYLSLFITTLNSETTCELVNARLILPFDRTAEFVASIRFPPTEPVSGTGHTPWQIPFPSHESLSVVSSLSLQGDPAGANPAMQVPFEQVDVWH